MSHVTLRNILDLAKKEKVSGNSPVFVFDIDSTLLSVEERILEILISFSNIPTNFKKFKSECKVIKSSDKLPRIYGLEDFIKKLGIESPSKEFLKSVESYWKKHFFSDEYLKYDQPYPGAADFLMEAVSYNIDIIYLTGRDSKNMKKGTVESLKEHGFPLIKSLDNLILKPNFNIEDHIFKVSALKDIYNRYNLLWLFENEPKNIKHIHKEYPDINIVFFKSIYSEDPKVLTIDMDIIESYK